MDSQSGEYGDKMRFVVAVKQVPDTTLIRVDEHGSLIRQGIPAILDPYAEHALEAVLGLKKPGDTVTVVTMGPPQAEAVLRRCLEIGADEAYLLADAAFAGADVHATAKTLSVFVKRVVPDATLIICGKQAADGDTGEVPAELAQMLGISQFCYVTQLKRNGDGFLVTQDYGDEQRDCRVPAGSVLSVAEGDLNRRLPSINRYLEATALPITVLNRVQLMLGAYSVGLKGSRTKIVESHAVRTVRTGKIFDGTDPVKAAAHLKEML